MTQRKLSRGKRFLAGLVATFIVLLVVVVTGELMVRFLSPRPSMYPRWQFSERYGAMLYPDRTMVHECPGRWRFEYHTNAYQCRGRLVPISNSYERRNVIVLGDSYSFGTGVADDDVYAAVLSERLGDGYDVVNCAVGGWGPTQHIRRFYEFGRLYDPVAVVLQFCDNDPRDNFKNRVTVIEDGRFRFRDSKFRLNFIKRFLSDSILQKSQLYNLVRDPIYLIFARRTLAEEIRQAGAGDSGEVPADQRLYNELVELFARDLSKRGISLHMISVDGQMEALPYIDAKVRE
ncbi:MAG: SGNH/GDSL hydrolase family protein, partial [Candidatus Eisenbacteria bacterium]|nr:SGNH/GDSL hydrolase family protein [Candidatus Eisenbacteria bacterium]